MDGDDKCLHCIIRVLSCFIYLLIGSHASIYIHVCYRSRQVVLRLGVKRYTFLSDSLSESASDQNHTKLLGNFV